MTRTSCRGRLCPERAQEDVGVQDNVVVIGSATLVAAADRAT
jgi:hypothetical protein